jgi:hypothetical protein
MAVVLKRRRFTIEEYHRMGEAGILSDDERVELIEGEIVEMTSIGVPQAATVDRLNHLFTSRLAGRVIVRVQGPIVLPAQDSEPQPDVTLLRPRDDFYARAHPAPDDVLLVVEVMDTSVERDGRVKLPLYARAGIPETWLVHLGANHVEVHRAPTAEGYRQARVIRPGGPLAVGAFPDVGVSMDEVLGPTLT